MLSRAVCTINNNNKKKQTWETPKKDLTSIKTADRKPAALLQMSPPIGIPLVYQTVCVKTIEWLFPSIPFAIKVKKILFTKFALNYR